MRSGQASESGQGRVRAGPNVCSATRSTRFRSPAYDRSPRERSAMTEVPSTSPTWIDVGRRWLAGVAILAAVGAAAWALAVRLDSPLIAAYLLTAAVSGVLNGLARANARGIIRWGLAAAAVTTAIWARSLTKDGGLFAFCWVAGLFLCLIGNDRGADNRAHRAFAPRHRVPQDLYRAEVAYAARLSRPGRGPDGLKKHGSIENLVVTRLGCEPRLLPILQSLPRLRRVTIEDAENDAESFEKSLQDALPGCQCSVELGP